MRVRPLAIQRLVMPVLIVVQVVCAALFTLGLFGAQLGLPPINWDLYELIELGAVGSLMIGVGMGIVALRRSEARVADAEARLRAASGAFMDMLEERFAAWGLTPAEKDVALFAIKGLSTPDIAAVRQTSEGTVKAQTNAIYRKAGVSGRPQLLSLFIEELMDGALASRTAGKIPPQAGKAENLVI